MANVKISALSTLSGSDVSSNDLLLISQVPALNSRSLSISNARIAISNANDYITYNTLNNYIADGFNTANANIYNTYLVAYANDGTTLGLAYSNDVITLNSARANDYASYLTLSGGIAGANTAIDSKDSISNVYQTYLTLSGGINSANTAIVNLQGGISGSNADIVSLRFGLVGANTINDAQRNTINNLQTGLSGANAAIAAITNDPVTFQSDVTIRGNLILTGNTTVVTANTIALGDSLISLASNNTTSDNLDIGLYGHFWNGSANSHAGIFRSSTSKDWFLFSNYTIDLQNNSVIEISNSSFELANIRVRSANASQDIYSANAVLSTRIFSSGVELRANDYATYLTALGGINGANTSILNLRTGLEGTNAAVATKDSVANVYSTYLVLKGGLEGANTVIATKDSVANVYATYLTAMSNDGATLLTAYSNDGATLNSARSNDYASYLTLSGGLSGANASIATKDTIANVYATYIAATSNDFITYTRLNSNINSVESNLNSFATYANSTFGTPYSIAYIVTNYTTTTLNSYYIGTTVSSVNNVSVYLNGVYQNKNQFVLANSSANIQFTDSSLAASLSLEIVTIR